MLIALSSVDATDVRNRHQSLSFQLSPGRSGSRVSELYLVVVTRGRHCIIALVSTNSVLDLKLHRRPILYLILPFFDSTQWC